MHSLPPLPDTGKLGTASLHEAAGKIGALPSAIKPLSPHLRLAGPAFPVQSPPADNLWLHRAIYEAAPGDILVVHTGDFYEAGYWGEIMSTAAQARQLGGLVIDAGVRDSQQLIAMGFPVFSRTVCIRGTGKNPQGAGSTGQMVRIGEIEIQPGDLVVGDADGVVVIPRARAAEVVTLAERREEAEARDMARLRAGERTIDMYKLPILSGNKNEQA